MIAYLAAHPVFRLGLFGDSTKDAVAEKRPKATAKDGKSQQWAVLAKEVFSNDESMKEEYARCPTRFAASVDTRFRR